MRRLWETGWGEPNGGEVSGGAGASWVFGAAAWLVLSGAAAAQDTDQAPAPPIEESLVEEVIITGSRLPAANFVSASPITSVSRADFEAAGALGLESLLNQLPQFAPSFSAAANNPSAGGAAHLDLRGLGAFRTLVLVNGRRIIGSDASNVVDVNILPPALVERVEVITGGASAVYGADAVAGVVNFILDDEFTGGEMDLRGQVSRHGDAGQSQFWLTTGGPLHGGRGHLSLGMGHHDREEVGKGARAFTAQASVASSFLPSGAYRVGGNPPSLAAVDLVFERYGVAPGAVLRGGGLGGFGFNADGTLYATGIPGAPFDAQNVRRPEGEVARLLYPDVFSYNYEPENKLILPLARTSVGAFGSYDLTDAAEVYGEAFFTRYRASTALASAPALGAANPLYPGAGITDFTIPVTNPFIPDDLRILLASRTGDSPVLAGSGPGEEFLYRFRATALGPRQSDNLTTAYNVVAGLRHRLWGDWSLDLSYSGGRYARRERQNGNLFTRRFEQLLDSPTGGTEFCAGGFNPFGVGLSRACGDYVRATIENETTVEQMVILVEANGTLWSLPAGQVLASVGYERRAVEFRYEPADAGAPGEIAGFFGTDPLGGALDYDDVFIELAAPILAGLPGVRSLDVNLGYRRSELAAGGVDSYKIEGRWSPVEGLRLRGSYQRAVRAPDVFELFSPPTEGGQELSDPCSSHNPARTPQVLQLCRRQAEEAGLPADFADAFSPAFEGAALVLSGNRDLQPESADTMTLGLLWRPNSTLGWLSDPHLSLDWWSIEIEGAIGYRDPTLVVNGCYNIDGQTNPTYDPGNAFCRQMRRSGSDFFIFDLQTPLVNESLQAASGVDLAAGARLPLDDAFGRAWLGVFSVELLATWLERHESQGSSAQPLLDSAGTIGSAYGATRPRWRINLDLGWNRGPLGLQLRSRYIDAMEHRLDRLSPTGDDPFASGVGPAWYFDLAARLDLGDRVTLSGGALNLLDREPELYEGFIDARTDPSTYDVIGRRFHLGINVRW